MRKSHGAYRKSRHKLRRWRSTPPVTVSRYLQKFEEGWVIKTNPSSLGSMLENPAVIFDAGSDKTSGLSSMSLPPANGGF